MNTATPSLQDYTLVKTYVDKITTEQNLKHGSLAFHFFVLDLILNLQQDEIEESITDTFYLSTIGKEKGNDRGIDAIYIDESDIPAIVHIFNFKYTEDFKRTSRFIESNEIDKISTFISAVLQHDDSIKDTVNYTLFSKIKDIWSLFQNQNPKFEIHICSNTYQAFEPTQQKRFEAEIGRYSNFEIKYHLLPQFVLELTKKGKQIVDAKLKAIDKNLFEKSDGDIRALILDIDARDLLRIVIDDNDLRNNANLDDYSRLRQHQILEDAFEDNVRIYLKLRSKINRNIKETALSDDAHRLFYFNNGITITCSHFDYRKQSRSPIVELENLQIVNGSQTIHALFDAFKENIEKFEDMDILCRIYETRNELLSTDIAEYTNSQNPVQTRDIRSNDYIQKKLEKELYAQGYFYERKKRQYSNKPSSKRIDAEKAGQALLAFINKMPAEAKDKKRIIFAEKYDEVFTDQITADTILLVMRLFEEVEKRKMARKAKILNEQLNYEDESYILHASYYILYALSILADNEKIDKINKNYQQIIQNYDTALKLIKDAINSEKIRLKGYKENYTHRMFFKGNRPKKHIEESTMDKS